MRHIITAVLASLSLAGCGQLQGLTVSPSTWEVRAGDYVYFTVTSPVARCVKLSSREGVFDTVQLTAGTTKTPVEPNARYQVTPQAEPDLPVTFSDCSSGEALTAVTLIYKN